MLDRYTRHAPSLLATLIALAIGFGGGFVFHYAEIRYGYNFDTVGWALIRKAGWWWWSAPIAVSVIGLYYTAHLNRPASHYGFATRVITLMGFCLFCGAWQNTALWSVAAITSVLAQVMLIRQLAVDCASRRRRPSYHDERWLVRVYAWLTTELDDAKGNMS